MPLKDTLETFQETFPPFFIKIIIFIYLSKNMYSLTISEVPSYPFKNTYFKVNITLLSDCQILPE